MQSSSLHSSPILANAEGVLVALIACSALLLAVCIWLIVRSNRLTRTYRTLTLGTDGGSIEDVLRAHSAVSQAVGGRVDILERDLTALQASHRKALQRVGVVRYDAFEDVGGEQSFSLALTDADGTGIALSGVYSRTDVRVYAKQLGPQGSSHPLSAEEQAALLKSTGKRP